MIDHDNSVLNSAVISDLRSADPPSDLWSPPPAVPVFISKVEHLLRLHRVHGGRQQLRGGNFKYLWYLILIVFYSQSVSISAPNKQETGDNNNNNIIIGNNKKIKNFTEYKSCHSIPFIKWQFKYKWRFQDNRYLPLINTGPLFIKRTNICSITLATLTLTYTYN